MFTQDSEKRYTFGGQHDVEMPAGDGLGAFTCPVRRYPVTRNDWPPATRNTAQCDAPPSRIDCDWLTRIFRREHCLLVRTYGKYINAVRQPSVLLSLLSAALFTKQHCPTNAFLLR